MAENTSNPIGEEVNQTRTETVDTDLGGTEVGGDSHQQQSDDVGEDYKSDTSGGVIIPKDDDTQTGTDTTPITPKPTDDKTEETEPYVSEIVWAFNPYYLDITVENPKQNYVDVYVASYKIKAALHGGEARVYISRLLQLHFTDPMNKHVWILRVRAEHNGEQILWKKLLVLWGGINLGERVFNAGVYHYDDGKGWLTYHVPCFVNFPYSLELLTTRGSVLRYRTNKTRYNGLATVDEAYLYPVTKEKMAELLGVDDLKKSTTNALVFRQDIDHTLNAGGTFDGTYDYTFHSPLDSSVITYVHFRYETEGYYLRWLSHHGLVHYYLFDKGEQTDKTTRSALIPTEMVMNGVSYGFSGRAMSVKAEREVKVCAVNLDRDTLAYVRDVVSSPYVDLYLGKTKDGQDIWQPVCVADGQFVTKTNHNYLSDFELTLELPNYITQTL